MSRQIGSVEIKRPRVYPSDPDDLSSPDVTVQPGIFPVMRSGDRIWWRMRGESSVRHNGGFERLGDGLFAVTPTHDELLGEVVSFSTKTFTLEEFAEIVGDDQSQDGPEQRLRIVLFEPLAPAFAEVR